MKESRPQILWPGTSNVVDKKNTGSSAELQIELKAMEKGPEYVSLQTLRYRNKALPTVHCNTYRATQNGILNKKDRCLDRREHDC